METIRPASRLAGVRYEIRGPLARRAAELERQGFEILKLNIGNPAAFGFRAPEALRRALVEGLPQAEGYVHQKGIFPAREAVAFQQQERGAHHVSADDVFIGNGVSELVLLTLGALLDPGDEVLLPSPDYPLWTAATTLHGGRPVHYPCRPEDGWVPDVAALAERITPRTRALVVISPNNPTGAVYPREVVEKLAALAEERGLIVLSDEIYDGITYDGAEHVPIAPLVTRTLCATFGGISKVHRACGYRVGWVSFSGEKRGAREYLLALDTLASLRLCANVPGQSVVQAALGERSIRELVEPGGRLWQTRAALALGVRHSRHLSLVVPRGALYAFVRCAASGFDDQGFALELLEKRHVLVTPGSGFNVPYRDHFRLTLLPDEATMGEVLRRIEEQLES